MIPRDWHRELKMTTLTRGRAGAVEYVQPVRETASWRDVDEI
jgi:hypothetical protein